MKVKRNNLFYNHANSKKVVYVDSVVKTLEAVSTAAGRSGFADFVQPGGKLGDGIAPKRRKYKGIDSQVKSMVYQSMMLCLNMLTVNHQFSRHCFMH